MSVAGLAGATNVAAGLGHTRVIGGTTGTQVLRWGWNGPDPLTGLSGGQLGDGSTTFVTSSVAVVGFP